MLLHNIQAADPLNRFAKAFKALTGNKNTEEYQEKMAALEMRAYLYVDDEGRICIPEENICKMIAAGAAKHRLGTQSQRAILFASDATLLYDGPQDPEVLADDPNFRYRKLAAPKRNARVPRTRPIFRSWGAVFTITYMSELMSFAQFKTAIGSAGLQEGLGDWRPRFGRFYLKDCKDLGPAEGLQGMFPEPKRRTKQKAEEEEEEA